MTEEQKHEVIEKETAVSVQTVAEAAPADGNVPANEGAPADGGAQAADSPKAEPHAKSDRHAPQRRHANKSKEPQPFFSLPRLLTAALVLIVLALAFALINRPGEPATKEETNSLKQISFPVKAGEAENYYPLAIDSVLRVDGGGVSLLNVAGVEIKRTNMAISKLIVVRAGNYAMAADFDGYQYAVYNGSGLVYAGKTEDPIKGIAISPRGYGALIMDRAASMGALRVLDNQGATLFDWVSLDRQRSGYILTATFSDNDRMVSIAMYNTESDAGFTIIRTMSLLKETIGQTVDEFEPQGIGPVTCMAWQGDDLYLASGRYLLRHRKGQSDVSLQMSRINDVLPLSGGLAVLGSESGDQATLYFWDGRAEKPQKFGRQAYPENSFLCGGEGACFGIGRGRTLDVYSSGNRRFEFSRKFSSRLLRGYLSNSGDSLVVSYDEVSRTKK